MATYEEELAYVSAGGYDEYVVFEFEDNQTGVVHAEICGYTQHNGPYQQYYHVVYGEREWDYLHEEADTEGYPYTLTTHYFETEDEVREYLNL